MNSSPESVFPFEATAVILAGGKSSRMKSDKTQLSINGENILSRTCSKLNDLFTETIVSGPLSLERFCPETVSVIADSKTECGPLVGIKTALEAANNEIIYVHAVDIPDFNAATLEKLFRMIRLYDIVVPTIENERPEPLMGFYNKSVLHELNTLVSKEIYRVRSLLEVCRTHVMQIEKGEWYYNLNTPEDLAYYKNRLR